MTKPSYEELAKRLSDGLAFSSTESKFIMDDLLRVRGLLQRLVAESFSGEKVLRCRLCGSKLEHGHFGNCIVHELEVENVR